VVSASPSDVQIAGDDKVTRTIPMSQVRAIEYAETPASRAEAPPASTATAPVAPPARGQASMAIALDVDHSWMQCGTDSP
jgi:hypothetical protein